MTPTPDNLSALAAARGLRYTAKLLADRSGKPGKEQENAFLRSLFASDPLSILERFEAHARRAFDAIADVHAQFHPSDFLGGENDFRDRFAELVTFSWLSDVFAVKVSKQLLASATLDGKPHDLDGALSLKAPGAQQVLVDVKSLRPQFRDLLAKIEEELSARLNAAGVTGKVSVSFKGSPQMHLKSEEEKKAKEQGLPNTAVAIIETGVQRITEIAAGKSVDIGTLAGCRLSAMRGGLPAAFWGRLTQVSAERAEVWARLKQMPHSEPFVLVLVSTYAGGLKHVGMPELLSEVLDGHGDEPMGSGVFGCTSSDPHPHFEKSGKLMKKEVQRYVSGLLFIDDERAMSRLYVNADALHPLALEVRERLDALKPPFPSA